MPEYIEREELLEHLNMLGSMIGLYKIFPIQKLVLYEPAADVAPVVHARWEKATTEFGITTKVRCSHCKSKEDLGFEDRPFCPNCGAKMDLEER